MNDPNEPQLRSSTQPLARRYDVALLDLDGVVYLGHEPIPGVAEALSAAGRAGMALAYVTNNASRTPQTVAELLQSLGIAATADQVVNSAQAGARLLSEHLPAGARVLVIGADALREEVRARGMQVVERAEDAPDGVIQGFSRDLGWLDLCEAVVAVRAGALWVATNADLTLPSPRGAMPGNGSLVSVVARVTGATPLVAGKPEPALHRESVDRTGARHPLVVGDRLDTDIEGANRAGSPSLLVFTGVTEPADVLRARSLHRPSYLAPDVGGLLAAHPAPQCDDAGWTCGGWRATRQDDRLELSGAGSDAMDALRALCAAAWRQEGGYEGKIVAAGETATRVAEQLRLC